MINLATNGADIILVELDFKTGYSTVPSGFSIIEIYDAENEYYIRDASILNPLNLDVAECNWDSVTESLVLSSVKQHAKRQNLQRIFGEHLIKEIIDMIGARNLDLITAGTPINITSMAVDNSGVKLLVETGALATAAAICGQLKLKYPTHTDIYEYLIADINSFLTGHGWT